MATGKGRTGQGLIAFKVEVDPSPAAIARAYRGIGKEFSDWRPAWQKLVPQLQKGIRQNFATQGGALGSRWKPNDPAYDVRPKKQGKAQLVLTGEMMQAFTGRQTVQEMGKGRLVFGSDEIPQARSTNFGRGGINDRTSPKRMFFAWSKQMSNSMLGILDDHTKALLLQLADKIAKLPEAKR